MIGNTVSQCTRTVYNIMGQFYIMLWLSGLGIAGNEVEFLLIHAAIMNATLTIGTTAIASTMH